MRVEGTLTVTTSDDPRFAQGEVYDLTLATGVVPATEGATTDTTDTTPSIEQPVDPARVV